MNASIDYQGYQVDREQFDAAEKAQETAMDKVNRSVQKIIRGLHLHSLRVKKQGGCDVGHNLFLILKEKKDGTAIS